MTDETFWLQPVSRELDWANATTRVRGWSGGTLELEDDCTHYLFAHSESSLLTSQGTFPMAKGMFAAVPFACTLSDRQLSQSKSQLALDTPPIKAALIVTHYGYRGMFQLGGPIERLGRLRYIDGCTDSLLLAPPLLGDPCLNHLHIPPGTHQTRHVHPSLRVGMIVRGEGVCITSEKPKDSKGKTREMRSPLVEGLAFMLKPGLVHCFHTTDASLDVVVYHPDSDTGPTHENHPMLNRTITKY